MSDLSDLYGMFTNTEKFGEALHRFAVNEMNRQLDAVDEDGVGAHGEDLTVEKLEKYVPGYYRIIRNVILPISSVATEIDIIMVHEKGIFVFESKNYSGWIFGNKDQKIWTQTLRRGRKTHFYNPIMQNRTHCEAIYNLTRVPRQYVMSYVVFSERCKLKVVPDNEMYLTIVQRQNLIHELSKDLAVRNVVFTHETVEAYAKGFQAYLDNQELKEKHLKNVRREGEKRDDRVCPRCGRKLKVSGYNGPILAMCPDFNRCSYSRAATREEINENQSKLKKEQQMKQMNEIFYGPHMMDFKNMKIIPIKH